MSTDAGRTVRGLQNVRVTVLMSTNTSGYNVLCTNSIGSLPRKGMSNGENVDFRLGI